MNFNVFPRLEKISNALMPLLLFSILVNVGLAKNYTQSLIPKANDRLGVSNKLAYFLLGKIDGPKSYFDQVIIIQQTLQLYY